MIQVFDDVLSDPVAYRAQALAAPFTTVNLGQEFRGIALPMDRALSTWFETTFPDLRAGLSFFRRSPVGQVEPNDIHNDVDMGDVTAILYLNPQPADGDGTIFWRHVGTGITETAEPVSGALGHARDDWEIERHVEARFNRVVVFDAALCHSRALVENYGNGDAARLIQVLFGHRRQKES